MASESAHDSTALPTARNELRIGVPNYQSGATN